PAPDAALDRRRRAADHPGRDHRDRRAAARLQRHGRLPVLRQADPRRDGGEDDQGQEGPHPDLQAPGLRPGDRSLMATATDTYTPRLKELYESEIRPRLKEELGLDS